MWEYSKKLQYPVRIKRCNPAMAKLIISQLGGLNCNKLYTASLSSAYTHFQAQIDLYITRPR